ncbi:MAG: biotin/lipoyl-containing protein [Thermoanaerobaculia bacterium]
MKFIAKHSGEILEVEVQRLGSGYRVKLGDRWVNVDLAACGRYVHSLRMEDGTQVGLVHHGDGTMHQVSLGGATVSVEVVDPLALRRKQRDDGSVSGGVLKALMPGRVVRVLVEKGARVRKGEGILILEAMKMENEIHAPVDGVVDQIFVEAGRTVEGGADLLHIEPDAMPGT